MSILGVHQARAFPDEDDFVARCLTCRWRGPWRHERDAATVDAVIHLADALGDRDVDRLTRQVTRRYSSTDYARWFDIHSRRLARERGHAAGGRQAAPATPAELLAERRLMELVESLKSFTQQRLTALRREGSVVLSTLYQDCEEAARQTHHQVADLQRRMREGDRCFSQIGIVTFYGQRHASRLETIAALRKAGRHDYAWHEEQPEGGCTVCTCGIMVLGTLTVDFTEAESLAASGHRRGRAWST